MRLSLILTASWCATVASCSSVSTTSLRRRRGTAWAHWVGATGVTPSLKTRRRRGVDGDEDCGGGGGTQQQQGGGGGGDGDGGGYHGAMKIGGGGPSGDGGGCVDDGVSGGCGR